MKVNKNGTIIFYKYPYCQILGRKVVVITMFKILFYTWMKLNCMHIWESWAMALRWPLRPVGLFFNIDKLISLKYDNNTYIICMCFERKQENLKIIIDYTESSPVLLFENICRGDLLLQKCHNAYHIVANLDSAPLYIVSLMAVTFYSRIKHKCELY